MSALVRFTVSLEKDLLERFERGGGRGASNRSQAVRVLLRQELVRREWRAGREVAGAITLIYDHHHRRLVERLMDVQHDFQKLILSTQHIHLDHDHCLEIVAVRGAPREVERLAETLRALKGMRHSTLSMTATGKGL